MFVRVTEALMTIRNKIFMTFGNVLGRTPLLLLAIVSSQMIFAQTTGTVSGAAVAEDGSPATGGNVLFVQTLPKPGVAEFAPLGSDGKFKSGPLPAGTYNVCVQLPKQAHLDPCRWDAKRLTVSVNAGQAATMSTIQLKKGAVVRVRLNDNGHYLQQKNAKGAPRVILLGITDSEGLFYPLIPTATDNNGADFQITIPIDTPVSFSAFSQDLHIGSTEANAVQRNAGFVAPVQVDKVQGQAGKVVTFTITGPAN
jgi:hypothetical protein